MDIFCPQFDLDTPREQMLKFAVYNVSKDTFHGCNFVKGGNMDNLIPVLKKCGFFKINLGCIFFKKNCKIFFYSKVILIAISLFYLF